MAEGPQLTTLESNAWECGWIGVSVYAPFRYEILWEDSHQLNRHSASVYSFVLIIR